MEYSSSGRNLSHVLDDPELRLLLQHHIAEGIFLPEARCDFLLRSGCAAVARAGGVPQEARPMQSSVAESCRCF